MNTKQTQISHLSNNCIVYWNRREKNSVPVLHPCCNIEQLHHRCEINKTVAKDYRCRSCKWKNLREQRKGKHSSYMNKRGYLIKDFESYSKEEQLLLYPMKSIHKDKHFPYIYEHRAIMALHINRALSKDEIIHHIDGNKTNNAISNLQLVNRKQHTLLHKDLHFTAVQVHTLYQLQKQLIIWCL